MNRRQGSKETWTMDVKDTQIKGLRGSQGCRYHIHGISDSRGDVRTHDLPPHRLTDSQDAICSMRIGEIIHVAKPYHLKTGILRVVWHAKVRKYPANSLSTWCKARTMRNTILFHTS